MIKYLIPAIKMTLFLAVLTGLIFPAVMTGLGRMMFPFEADGSLLIDQGKVVGSSLIAQSFSSAKYFHARPSAAGSGYKGEASGGTNLGPTSSKLILGAAGFDGIKQLAATYRLENSLLEKEKVPVDAVTRSASGLDPDISFANATFQARRVARARSLNEADVLNLVQANICRRQFGILGEPRVNVLKLNLALDSLKQGG